MIIDMKILFLKMKKLSVKNLIKWYLTDLVGKSNLYKMKINKMFDVMVQWIVAWIALYWLIQGYIYILKTLN